MTRGEMIENAITAMGLSEDELAAKLPVSTADLRSFRSVPAEATRDFLFDLFRLVSVFAPNETALARALFAESRMQANADMDAWPMPPSLDHFDWVMANSAKLSGLPSTQRVGLLVYRDQPPREISVDYPIKPTLEIDGRRFEFRKEQKYIGTAPYFEV